MGRKKDLTSEERAVIDALTNEGFGPRHIGRAIGRSHSCVSGYLLRPAGTKGNSRKGRTSKISQQTRRAIIRSACNEEISGAEIKRLYGLPISIRTVNRILATCPTAKHKKKWHKHADGSAAASQH
jgi:IS30 family transposase